MRHDARLHKSSGPSLISQRSVPQQSPVLGADSRARWPLQRGGASGGGGGRSGHCGGLPVLLPQVDLGVPLALVAARKLAAAEVAGERLLARVRADVRSEVVTAAEVAHADAALEGLVSGVDADVSGEFVGAGEPPVAALGRTRVRPLMDGCFAGPVRVLPRPQDGPQGQVLRAVG